MAKKTYQEFQDYLNRFKEALLDLIPDFYDDSIPPLGSKSIEWGNRKNFILKELQEIIENLDAITKEYTIPPLRYKLYFPVYDNKDNPLLEGSIEEISENVITFFLSNLAKLRSEGVKQNTAKKQILEEMHKQEREYLEKYGDKLKTLLGSKVEKKKKKGNGEHNFDDVKVKISADNLGQGLDEAFVTVNNGNEEKLVLDSRFIEGLHSLAAAVKGNTNHGWVFNKDLDRTCSDGATKLKYEIKNAFKKIIGKRAEVIISIKPGVAKKLNIPKKNISFKHIS